MLSGGLISFCTLAAALAMAVAFLRVTRGGAAQFADQATSDRPLGEGASAANGGEGQYFHSEESNRGGQ